MAEVDSLEIQISASEGNAEEKIEALIGAMERLESVLNGFDASGAVGNLERLGAAAENAASQSAGRREILGGAFSGASSAASERQGALDEACKDVGATEVTGPTVSPSVPSELDGVLDRLQTIKDAVDALNGSGIHVDASSAERVDGSAPGPEGSGAVDGVSASAASASEKVGILSSALAGALPYLSKFSSEAMGAAGKALGALGKALRPVDSYLASSFTRPFQRAVSALKSWKSAIGRIMFYRAIRSALRIVTQGFTEGIKNLYEYSRLAGTAFAPAMNSLSTSALYLKNSFGAMAAPLIEAVAPVVDALVDRFVALLNVVGKVFALLSGKSVYTQAKKYAKEYGDALGGAAGAAKALKDYTLGIDELNVLNDSGGAGGGGAGSAMDYGSMFEEVEVGDGYGWAKAVMGAIRGGKWGEAGKLLAAELNALVRSVPWARWGKNLGRHVQNALELMLAAFRGFDWKGLGKGLAKWLTGAISAVRPEDVGAFFAEKIAALVESGVGFVSQMDFGRLGAWLSGVVNGWFREINWADAGRLVGRGVSGVLETAVAFVKKLRWGEIVKALLDVLGGIDLEQVKASLLDAFPAVGEAFGEILSGLGLDGGGIGAAFAAFGQALSPLVDLLIDGLGWAYENVLLPLADWKFTQFDPELIGAASTALGLLTDALDLLLEGVKTLSSALSPIVQWVADNALEKLKLLRENVSGFGEVVREKGQKITEIFSGIGQIISSVWSFVEPIFSAWQDVINALYKTVFTVAKSSFSVVIDVLHGVISFVSNVFRGNWEDAWDAISSSAIDAWAGIRKGITPVMNGIIGVIESFINYVVAGINGLIRALNKIGSVGAAIGLGFTVGEIPEVSIPRLAAGGVIRKNREFLAILGDNRRETEVISPISTMREAFSEVYEEHERVRAQRAETDDRSLPGPDIGAALEDVNRGVIDTLLEICGRLVAAIEENRTDVQIGDEEIYKAGRRYEQRAGKNTTRGAFAYVR